MSQPYVTQPGFWARLKERRQLKKQAKLLDKAIAEENQEKDNLDQRLTEQENALKKIETALKTQDFSTLLEDSPNIPLIENQSDSSEKTDEVLKF